MLKPDTVFGRVFSIRLPLLVKMMVLLLSVALVPLIIVGAMSIRRGVDAVGQTAEQNLQLVASTAGARLDQVLSQAQRLQVVLATAETVVQGCATPPARRKALLSRVEQWLKEVLSSNPDFALAYVADEHGICLVSTSPNMVGRDYKKTREYMRLALRGENVISDLAVGITTHDPGVFLAGPVRDRNGELLGVVVLKLKGEVIDRVSLDVSKQTAQGFAVVIDANSVIISHPNPKLLYQSIGTLSAEALKQVDPRLQYGVERIESAGEDYLAQALRQGHSRGYLMGTGASGLLMVAGYARMTQRPWTVAVVQPRAQFDRPMRDLATAQNWWTVGMGMLAALGALWITYSLLRPIRALRAAAIKGAGGDWSARATVFSNDELGDLAQTFNAMMPALKERVRMQEDLRVAREIQMGMVLHDFAGMEEAYGVEFSAVLLPAREVGGDLYGVCTAAKERLVVFLGDVSGKGIPASMFMVRAISLAQLLSRDIVEPERILERLNDELSVDNPSGMFVTFLCVVFDPRSGLLTLANAGQCRPILLATGEPPRWAVEHLGTALGFEPGLQFERTELRLRRGDALVFYTDGVSEAFNPQDECYGNERLLADVGTFGGQPAHAITAGLLQKVYAFANGAQQSDDIAILALRVGGASGKEGGA
jgi:sigma-B regulation protein RsbU (phosphoserine phosphatase)